MNGTEQKEGTEMDDAKAQIKRDSRRHSNKLIKKLSEVVGIPEIAQDRIHQEVLYASQDAYRTTMRLTRNGDMKYDNTEQSGNR